MDVRKLSKIMNGPLSEAHPFTWKLLGQSPLYEIGELNDDMYAAAMKENTIWHYEKNETYRAYCCHLKFDPRDLLESADIGRIPALSADLFKHFDLSGPHAPGALTVSSSGTSGRPTTLSLDEETIIRMWKMGRATFEAEGLVSLSPVHYLIFSADPKRSPHYGNSLFFSSLVEFAPAMDVTYAVEPASDGVFRLNHTKAIELLQRASGAGEPVRIIGLPALISSFAFDAPPGQVRLNPESLVLTGAGWKTNMHTAMSKTEFRDLLCQIWGLSHDRVRDLYGMTEHAVHYLDCPEHHFHAPIFSRVSIIDPLTCRPVREGEPGVIHLMNPGFTSMPLQSLKTADVGRTVLCACGRKTPAFELIGRGGRSRFRGCAATTLDRVRHA
ncbi:MAG: hypothetical protein AABZ15_10995 [Nitrospirota bacterium]